MTETTVRETVAEMIQFVFPDLDFFHPVRVGQIAILRARVKWVVRSSLEVGVRVYAETGGDLAPLPAVTLAERRHWESAERRQVARVASVRQLRESVGLVDQEDEGCPVIRSGRRSSARRPRTTSSGASSSRS